MNIELETRKHQQKVQELLLQIIRELAMRAQNHDKSKLEDPEKSIFEIYTPKLKGTTYGSPEYNEYLKEMKPALDHHYANNSHHPEYYENGVNDMTLMDLLEMVADWYAAGKRHADGSIKRTIEINSKRFLLSNQLISILTNTLESMEDLDGEHTK